MFNYDISVLTCQLHVIYENCHVWCRNA